MKSHTIKAIIILIAGIMISSCTTTVEQAVSTGKDAEILVYMDNKLWESDLGDSLQSIFMQPQQGLNQIEPMFTMLHLESLDKLFKKHRNILKVEVHDTIREPVLQYSENLFAKPQTYVKVKASSKEKVVSMLRNAEKVLFEKFRQTDYARIQRAYKMQENVAIQNKIKNKFGVSMVIPKSFYVAKESPDFMWLRLETNRYSQGLMIYRKKFNDSTAMQPQSLISWKNMITQIHIPGEAEGSFMRTDTATYPLINNVKWNNIRVLEARGLWLVIGDFMGGPYVTLFMTDPELKHIYAFDTYVYYPSRNKRDLVLQLESIIHSVRFIKT